MAGPGHGAPGVLGPRLPGGDLFRGLSRQEPRRGRAAALLPAVLVSRRHRQPLHARDARIDPRRRRTRLRAVARLRRCIRQPRADRRSGGRRRRGRDRPARHLVAHLEVPQPDSRRRGAAGAQPERLQDQQPDAARAHHPRGAARTCSAATAGRRTSSRAPIPTRCTRPWPRRSTAASPRSARRSAKRAASGSAHRVRWPMIVLRSPKGWTAPREVDGHQLEGLVACASGTRSPT